MTKFVGTTMTKIIARIVAQSIAILSFQRSLRNTNSIVEDPRLPRMEREREQGMELDTMAACQRATVQDVEDRKEAYKQGMGVECRSGAQDVEDRKEE